MAEFINRQVRDIDFARRNANYKTNIWNYEHLQSLTKQYDVCSILCGVENRWYYKLELIDEMNKIALSHYFEKDIIEVVNEIAQCSYVSVNMNQDPYITALYFRILRQHGYNVSPDAFLCIMDDEEKFIKSAFSDTKTIIEVFEASHLLAEDECVGFDKAKTLASKYLKMNYSCTYNIYSLKRPLHWSVSWFNVKKNILQAKHNAMLIKLARLSFNIVQVQHQNDLKEILRWWKNLGLLEVLTFTRDRVVESFLCAVGVAYEPQYGSLRKWLTKAITLILIIDDVYDIYGSMKELEQFTYAVERWDPKEIQQLPKAIKRCFWVLYDTTNDMDLEIQKEKNWNSVLPHLKRVWTDFCRALLVEAKWYHTGHTPTLLEYLENGWISSSGYVLSLHALLGVGQDMTKIIGILNNSHEIIYHSSLIIRLYNDKSTSKAELERGDAPSSIRCYMSEANVTEEEARCHIENTITCSWKKINGLFISRPRSEQPFIEYIINTARVANFIYQNGDGFGDQDGETRDQVLSCLIEPLPLA
ncbi:hypothetical protein ACJIZ3_005656 [Penstemon smallii]|uniref:Uncharacterized protein n=1 Tax=Penstemon smallii TaxID=265156 RepID=A0ABD3S5K6_9LAMI